MRVKPKRWTAAAVVHFVLSIAVVNAGEYLDKSAVEALVTGNTAEMNLEGSRQSNYMAKGHYRTIKFFSDGRIQQRTARGKVGTTTETGSWRVEDDGRLCTRPKGDREKCRALKPAGGNRYELYDNKGERKATWNRVVPGT